MGEGGIEDNSLKNNMGTTNNLVFSINQEKALAETFTLTAFFRSLTNYPYSDDIISFLISKSSLKKEDLQKRWDSFDMLGGEASDYSRLVSALSFSTIIEARGILLDSILISEIDKNSVVLELASGFSPRGINLINNNSFLPNQYIETDKKEVVGLKKSFYDGLEGVKTPVLSTFDVINDDISGLRDIIINLKTINPNINSLSIVSEGLLIYLTPKEQKIFFDNLKEIAILLKKYDISVNYLSIDMPTCENFTDWLLHEGFTHDDHIEVMRNVEPKILECLHNTENDFFRENLVDTSTVKKYYYDTSLLYVTSKLDKYRDIPMIEDKIKKFLGQKILYAYKVSL